MRIGSWLVLYACAGLIAGCGRIGYDRIEGLDAGSDGRKDSGTAEGGPWGNAGDAMWPDGGAAGGGGGGPDQAGGAGDASAVGPADVDGVGGVDLAVDNASVIDAGQVPPPDGAQSDSPSADAPTACAQCPPGLILLLATTTALVGGSAGMLYGDPCPDQHVVVGFEGATENAATPYAHIAARCGRIRMSATAPHRISSITWEGVTLPARGTGGVVWAASCPSNQAVTGFQGRADGELYALSFVCQAMTVGPGSGGAVLSPSGPATVEPLMGLQSGNSFSRISCPTDQVAIGTYLRSDGRIHAFGLLCGQFYFQPP